MGYNFQVLELNLDWPMHHSSQLLYPLAGGKAIQDRLMQMGMIQVNQCLQSKMEESLDPLYFTCPFSTHFWHILGNKCNIPRFIFSWNDTIKGGALL